MKNIHTYTDKELVTLSQKGDQKATEELYKRYIGLIKKHAYQHHLLTERTDVEAQLTLLFVEAIKEYDETLHIPFAGFVQSKIHFGAWNTFKKLRHRWQHEIGLLLDEENPTQEPTIFVDVYNVEKELLQREDLRKLHRALRRLSITERRLLTSYYRENKNFSDIAKERGCTRQAIRYTYLRILDKLRKYIK